MPHLQFLTSIVYTVNLKYVYKPENITMKAAFISVFGIYSVCMSRKKQNRALYMVFGPLGYINHFHLYFKNFNTLKY